MRPLYSDSGLFNATDRCPRRVKNLTDTQRRRRRHQYLRCLFGSVQEPMANVFAAASSFFNRTNISQSYNIGAPTTATSRSSTPGPSTVAGSSLPIPTFTPTFHVGPWKVQSAVHKVTNKRVSVWTYDKRSDTDRTPPHAKEKVIETLKGEVSVFLNEGLIRTCLNEERDVGFSAQQTAPS